MWVRLTHRSNQHEKMDDLNCSGAVVDQTLKELEVINRLLGGNSITLDGINKIIVRKNIVGKTIEIADLGCGGGDMLKLVAQWARKSGIKVRLLGIDANPYIIKYACLNSCQYPEIEFKALDIFSREFQHIRFDIVICTLFAHHFEDRQLVSLFRSIKRQSRYGVVINDLHRHWVAYWSITLLTRLFSKSLMIQSDAPISVMRGFRRQELHKIIDAAGINNFRLKWKWAFRWQILIYA